MAVDELAADVAVVPGSRALQTAADEQQGEGEAGGHALGGAVGQRGVLDPLLLNVRVGQQSRHGSRWLSLRPVQDRTPVVLGLALASLGQ